MIFLFNPFSWEELRRDAMYRSIGFQSHDVRDDDGSSRTTSARTSEFDRQLDMLSDEESSCNSTAYDGSDGDTIVSGKGKQKGKGKGRGRGNAKAKSKGKGRGKGKGTKVTVFKAKSKGNGRGKGKGPNKVTVFRAKSKGKGRGKKGEDEGKRGAHSQT